uniref:TOG domain-containing protein n=1 Tax=Panagrellus redivivus TaxID=6233 RepID=A0A7E4ZU80_PANRE
MGEASEQQEVLKTAFQAFLKHYTSDSQSEQENLVSALVEAVKAVPALPEPLYKHVLNAVVDVSFHRFADRGYFTILGRLVDTLFQLDPKLSLKHLSDAVLAVAVPNVALLTTRAATGATFVARWLVVGILANKKLDNDAALLKKAVSAFAGAAFYAAYLPKRVLSVSNQTNKLFKADPDLVLSSLKEFSSDSAGGDLKALVLIALLLKKDSAASKSDKLPALKTTWLDTYIKVALLAKTPLNSDYFAKLNTVLSYYTPKELEETFLPNVKKALLRGPEVAAPAILDFVKHLPFESDVFAVAFIQALASSITSTSDAVRESSVAAVGVIAGLIGDSSVLEKYSQQLFDLFKANASKLPQRTSVAIAILSATKNVKSGSAKIPESVVLNFQKILPSETNSAVLHLLWDAFTTWILKGEKLEKASIDVLKKGVSSSGDSKSLALTSAATVLDRFSSVPVDTDILKAATAVCAAAKSEQTVHVDFIPSASIVLLANAQKGEHVDPVLFETLSTKDSLLREKVYTSFAGEQGKLIPILAKRALLSSLRPTNATDYPAPIVKLLCASLVWPNYIVRQTAVDVVKKLTIVEGAKLRKTLVESLLEAARTDAFDEVYTKASGIKSHGEDAHEAVVPSAFYAHALLSLLPEKKSDYDSEEEHLAFLTSSLFLASAPRVVEHDGAIWLHWVENQVELRDLVHSDDFCNLVFDRVLATKDGVLRANVIRLLMSTHFQNSAGDDSGAFVADRFWTRFSKEIFAIDTTLFADITPAEVGIFRTPEGKLYNEAVIDENSDLNLDASNMKRENKAYKHSDQLAEIEIRKALAEKNRREGKLTPRQKKAVDAELIAESQKRAELRKLYDPVEIKLTVLAEAARYNPQGACFHVGVLYEIVVPLLRSRLVCNLAAQTFLAFSDAFFEPSTDSLGALVGTAALRVLGAYGYADVPWPETLVEQLTRVFNALLSLCIVVDIPFDEEIIEEDAWQDSISAWKLSFLVPVIEKILPSNHPIDLKLKVSNFLKSAINKHFLSDEDVILPPLARIHTFIVKQICADPYSDTFDDLRKTVNSYCTLVNVVEEAPEATKNFYEEVVRTLRNPTELLRQMALEWLNLSGSYLLRQIAEDADFKQHIKSNLYLSRFDRDAKTQGQADQLWALFRFVEGTFLAPELYGAVTWKDTFVQDEAAEALNDLATQFPDFVEPALEKLFAIYDKYLDFIPPVKDTVGRVVVQGRDPVLERDGVCKALIRLSPTLSVESTQGFIERITERFNEPDPNVHTKLRAAGIIAIRNHGKHILTTLLPFLDAKLSKTPDSSDADHMRQGLVVLLGTLGTYLGSDPDRVLQIFKKLIEVLSTPSEQVQRSVAECLPQLVDFIENHANDTLESLLHIMEASQSYGERRGAAYGIAAIISGLGSFVIVETALLKRVDGMIQSKNHYQRESALLIMEMLFALLGKSSEPFMPAFIPSLLSLYGDSKDFVRAAATAAGNAMMAALSKHGAKLIVPLILAATENDNWRTKKASAELLGAVSQCAPRQLSSCLPKVVPTLCELLTDSHYEVQKSSERALREIAKVIRNPEIMSIAPHLIAGLTDPVAKTASSLETVVNTRFIHYMDPPSLALIMPIVRRAFRDRNTDARKMSSQIIASIYTLTDQKDMEPYLTTIVPGLQNALLDGVPEVRTVAARAFGAVLRYSSETVKNQVAGMLIPWLKQRLVSSTSMVDRSGAAQGLAETIAAFGEEYLDASMPEIISITENPKAGVFVRDGYLLLFIYLPIVFRERFVNFLSSTVSPLLVSLADENEIVRSTALRAGQQLINLYVTQARNTLLPQLQKALFDANWRIRHASVQLIGDYLFNISGVSGKMTSATADEDDTLGVEAINKAILANLGRPSRDEIFSGLYLCRQDVALVVRQAASHVWKVVVPNTPRVLRDIMETLFSMLLKCLASPCSERQQTAARCLGEVVKKMGERLLLTILPILKTNLDTDVVEQRLGVAEALNEVLQNCTRDAISMNAGPIMIILNRCLSDTAASIRAAAAPPFNLLMQIVGPQSVEDIVVPMVDKFLESNDDDTLDALCMIVNENPRQFLPPILGKLTKPPINAHGLCRIAAASGSDALNRHLPQFLGPLLAARPKKAELDDFVANCLPALLAITEYSTMQAAVSQLFEATAKKNNILGIALIRKWVENSRALFDEDDVVDDILRAALSLYAHESADVVEQAVASVAAVILQAEQGHAIEYLPIVKSALDDVAASGHNAKGFSAANGFGAFQKVLKEAFFAGSNGQKEQAIIVCELFTRLAVPAGITPHAVFIAGPLIRAVGDRFLADARKSSLLTLKALFEKVPTAVRPFVPQVHTELIKLFQVENLSSIKGLFAATLCHALCHHIKSEIVVSDMVQLLAATEDAKILELAFLALREVVPRKKAVYSADTLAKIAEAARDKLSSPNTAVAMSAAALSAQALLAQESLSESVIQNLTTDLGAAYTLQYCLLSDRTRTVQSLGADALATALTKAFFSTDAAIAESAVRSAAYVVIETYPSVNAELVTALARLINHQSNDVKILVGNAFSVISAERGLLDTTLLRSIVPMLINGTQEKNSAVRTASELGLVDIFALHKSREHFDNYLAGLEDAGKRALENLASKFLDKRLSEYQSQPLSSIDNFVTVF